jgi:putative flavoprotein involved in K+ transport
MRRLFIGDLTSYGLPFPASPVSQQFARSQVVPIVYDPFAKDVRAGRIRVVGQIKEIEGQTVHAFKSVETKPDDCPEEAELNVDAIVAGTGFRTGLTKLIQVPGITTGDDRPIAQGDYEFPDAPRLYILGHFVPLSGYLREIRLDAGRIATRIGKQLAARSAHDRAKPHQSMQTVEE